jgi:nucleoside-diphosphate-sugar epimerase
MARLGSSNNIGRYIASRRGAKANQGLINFLCTLPHKPVITYVSGSLMYGNQVNGEVATEHSPLNPTSYAKHYIFAEQPWLEAQKNTDLDIRFARPGWIVGAESWFRFFYWLPYCQSGKVPLYGTGNQLMSLVHLTDCAGQIVNLAYNGTKGQNMNIYSGLPVTQSYFSMLLAKLLNAEVEPIPESVLVKNYGKTVCEALLSTIPIQTLHSNIYNQYNNMYTTTEDILRETLLSLKNK